jgi:hypothetical protein
MIYPISLTELRDRASRFPNLVMIPTASAIALLDAVEAARELPKIQEALQRIQGIADADGGRLLGDYGFTTIKDALYEARLLIDNVDEALSRFQP